MKSKNILIFGGTGGIGQAIIRKLQLQQINIYLIGRSQRKISEVSKKYHIRSSQTFCVPSITSETDWFQVSQWLKKLGVLFDAGIHCAGKSLMKKVAEIRLEEWQRLIDINLTSAFSFYRLIWDAGTSKNFDIVYFGSASTDNIWPKNALYGSSKIGLEMFAKVLQKEIRPKGGRVWLYKPGSVNTSFFDNIKNHVPVDKMISPDELAEIVVNNLSTDPNIYYPEIEVLSY